ncbi:MAG: formate--tetrahydrofolate ligase [Candidatus Hodarchaeales archaeon]
MKSSLEIAQEAKMQHIEKVAATIGLTAEDIDLFGKYIAKISLTEERKKEIMSKPKGKYILVTATSPTPAGEGKTTTAIGLTQGLAKLGHKSLVTLRQPSLGPVFGIKGGAAGAGFSQVLPMEQINLGFTGDFNKIESAHNLLSAMMDNHIFRKNKLDLDLTTIQWKRVMDMNDRALRDIVTGLGDPAINGVARSSGFDITAASEIMALMALAKDLPDLRKKLGKIVVGRNRDGKLVTSEQLKAAGAMAALLKDAIKPNIVQTIEGSPVFIHIGPFGNIAHGCSSIVGDDLAIHLSDYVITEAGFGSDLGAEKFFNIKCRNSGMFPNAAVLVTTVKALKMHGGIPFDREKLKEENLQALKDGLPNLGKHIANMSSFGVPCVVALNFFPTDTDAEIDIIKQFVSTTGAAGFAVSKCVAEGGEGAKKLANEVIKVVENNPNPTPKFIYELSDSIEKKMETISQVVYGAKGVIIPAKVQKKIDLLKKDGYNDFPIVMAKTHLSLTEDPTVRGAPTDFWISIADVRLNAGAGFIYPIVGSMLTMPGLGPVPAAENIDINDTGKISGLF